MQFDNSVSDLLKDIGKALNNHVDKIKTQQKIYIETYNALMNIPVIKQIIEENNKLKKQLNNTDINRDTSEHTVENISLEIKDIVSERKKILTSWEKTIQEQEEEEEHEVDLQSFTSANDHAILPEITRQETHDIVKIQKVEEKKQEVEAPEEEVEVTDEASEEEEEVEVEASEEEEEVEVTDGEEEEEEEEVEVEASEEEEEEEEVEASEGEEEVEVEVTDDDEEEEEEEEEELEEVIINGKSYYTSDTDNGEIYDITDDGDIGDLVGNYKQGKTIFL